MSTHEELYSTLLPRREEILNFIEDYHHEHGWMPSIREIAAGLNLTAPSSVSYHLRYLEKLGYLVRLPGKPRCLTLSPYAVSLEVVKVKPGSRKRPKSKRKTKRIRT